jgi:hypothetical protein
MSIPSVSVDESALRASYARAQLADIERRRQVYLAALDGMPQREIARSAHLSQASVHRLIAKARLLGIEESLEEIVLSRFIGAIDDAEMMRQLATYPNWVPRVVDPVDGVLPEDSESELDTLVAEGFLTDDEADAVIGAHA